MFLEIARFEKLLSRILEIANFCNFKNLKFFEFYKLDIFGISKSTIIKVFKLNFLLNLQH